MEYKSPGFRGGTRHRVEFISRVGTFPFACSLKSARNWWLVNFISSNDVDSIRHFVDTLLVDTPRFLPLLLVFYIDTIDWRSDIRLPVTNGNRRDQDFTVSGDNRQAFRNIRWSMKNGGQGRYYGFDMTTSYILGFSIFSCRYRIKN